MKILSVLPLISIYSICTAAYVDKLNIIGNDHTKMHIIKRELHHPIPSEYDSTLALEDRNRIYNLGLFSKVEIEPIDSFYTISLVETFQFVPVPMVEHSETKGWRFGGAIAILNFRGINQQLSFGANTIIGEEFNYGLSFSDPWIIGDHVSLSGWAFQASGTDPFEEIDSDTLVARFAITNLDQAKVERSGDSSLWDLWNTFKGTKMDTSIDVLSNISVSTTDGEQIQHIHLKHLEIHGQKINQIKLKY